VKECEPWARAEMFKITTPLVRGWEEMGVPLSRIVTEPVGFGAVELVTVAVSVRGDSSEALERCCW
jgi:hypothetical protein